MVLLMDQVTERDIGWHRMTRRNRETPAKWHKRSLMVTVGHPLDTAHNPKVAGSNPALATNKEPAQRPFPKVRRGPLSCPEWAVSNAMSNGRISSAVFGCRFALAERSVRWIAKRLERRVRGFNVRPAARSVGVVRRPVPFIPTHSSNSQGATAMTGQASHTGLSGSARTSGTFLAGLWWRAVCAGRWGCLCGLGVLPRSAFWGVGIESE